MTTTGPRTRTAPVPVLRRWLVEGRRALLGWSGGIVAVTAAWVALGLLSGATALAAGAATGRRSWVLGAGAGIAVVGYVLQAVANNAERLDWLRRLSPYEWAFGSDPLATGPHRAGLALLVAGAALLVAVAAATLDRRDVLG